MFIFPPRAEVKIPPTMIDEFDLPEYSVQVKLNGSAVVVRTDGNAQQVWNRHGEPYTKHDGYDFRHLHRGNGDIVLAGEFLDKNLTGEHGVLNKVFVIWDILEFGSRSLAGMEFQARLDLLQKNYETSAMQVDTDGFKEYQFISSIVGTPSWMVNTFAADEKYLTFKALYFEAIPTHLYEGLLFKKLAAPLENGYKSINNTGWQVKCRKPTKNYYF